MAFDEGTIRQVLQAAESEGAPAGVVNKLDADLREVLHQYRARLARINRHSEVLSVLADNGFKVMDAARELKMTREGVYKHIRKSTENHSGVDAEAA